MLADFLFQKLSYKKGERDMVAMHHIYHVDWPSKKSEVVHSSYIRYGDNKASAMAYTVGIPCGIATQLILDRKINTSGVVAPLSKEIYEPVNNELYRENIRFSERIIQS
eukprot:NODE_175_length_14138_cov_1.015314.p14 type:complete len:109 gc:universal NODE_175_length_14138_cov_1.015314:3257-3583(+)